MGETSLLERDRAEHAALAPVEDQLPFHGELFGNTLEEVELNCTHCGALVTQLRGRFADHPTCIEINLLGVCEPCGRYVRGRMRWTHGNRLVFLNRHGNWRQAWAVVTWRDQVCKLWNRLFR